MLETFKELVKSLTAARLPTGWLLLLPSAAFLDLYGIAHFHRSLLTFLQGDPQSMSAVFGSRWIAEVSLVACVAATAWFYLLPLVVVPLWRAIVFLVKSKLPEWVVERARPSVRDGFLLVRWARDKAITSNNPLLLAECERKKASARQREFLIASLLGFLLFSLGAAFAADNVSGSSLFGVMTDELHERAGLTVIVVLLAMPGLALAWSVLMDGGLEQDSYIHLPDLVGEYEQSNTSARRVTRAIHS